MPSPRTGRSGCRSDLRINEDMRIKSVTRQHAATRDAVRTSPSVADLEPARGSVAPIGNRLFRGLAVRNPCLCSVTPSTAPPPFFRGLTQTRCHRVVSDIAPDTCLLGIVPYPMIVRFGLPESLARPAQDQVRLPRRLPFPALQDVAQCLVRHRPEN